MSLLHPPALWALAGLGIVILLRVWRARPVRLVVSSVLPWREVASEAASRRRRRRLDPVLLLQLLACAALGLGAASPFLVRAARVGRAVAVVIDNSAPMATREEGGTRLKLAKREAWALLESLDPADRVAVIQAAPVAQIYPLPEGALPPLGLWGPDVAVNGTNVSCARPNLPAAIALARTTLGPECEVHVWTYNTEPLARFAETDDRVALHRVGTDRPNRGIVSLGLERTGEPERYEIVAGVVGTGEVEVALLDVVANRELGRKRVAFAAGRPGATVFKDVDLKYVRAVEVRVSGEGEDALSLDDAARATRRPHARPRAVWVGEPSAPLARALEAAGAEVVRASPDADLARLCATGTLLVANRVKLAELPACPCLVIAPPASVGPVRLAGGDPEQFSWKLAEARPPLEPDEGYLEVSKLPNARVTGGGTVLLGSNERPFVVMWKDGAAERVCVLFALEDSNWPRTGSFPVLVASLLERAAGDVRSSFDIVRTKGPVGADPVNLLDPEASDIRPRGPVLREAEAAADGGERRTRTHLAWACLAFAVLAMTAAWFIQGRRE